MNSMSRVCRRSRCLVVLGLALLWAHAAVAYEAEPRFGPDAVPIVRTNDYLRTHPAPDYWAISPFYIAQDTDSACTVASLAMLLNALRGVPERADVDLITSKALRAALADERWTTETAENGAGVRFVDLVDIVRRALRKYDLENYDIEIFRPADASAASLTKLQSLLAANEQSDRDFALLYFNQGVLTGDWDGPHVSPLGAYDSESGRALVMDVDRRYYVPYWSPVGKVLQSMIKPAPASFGPLAGETGGILWVRPKRH
jgi:hypothetical protein